MQLVERRLVIEQINLGRASIHEEIDDPFRLRREVRQGIAILCCKQRMSGG
jgi:hypothetical protein